ncbi:unnamed protein product [Microthlaspi erraticum]|uniref:Uncharacterized protein n=1 Tax=Microthlaspi erraticum TaxID=1685480 RepID=A0A6D2K8D0_9BRAS|nr:unnamed protein product [Microthlaspi erraticum]
MDFIKTSSLRALSELTFQRNWNGLIWMSRKGVITKRVKTGPGGSIEKPRPSRAERPAEKRMFPRSAKIKSIRLKSRPKFKLIRPSTHHDPGSNVPRSAKPRPLKPCRARPCRASREASLAAARPNSRTTADGAVRAGKPRPASGRESIGQSFTVRPQRPTENPSGHDRSDPRPRPDCPADRPDRPSERRGRPEARFDVFSRPGLTLSRL